jgi:NTP pyrophosphatase (non-canonical NTP hydrolase)
LKPEEIETLIILAEECSEVAQACTKVLRFGFDDYDSRDPDRVPNYKKLETEIGDVIAMVKFAIDMNVGITQDGIEKAFNAKLEKLKKYSSYLYDKS